MGELENGESIYGGIGAVPHTITLVYNKFIEAENILTFLFLTYQYPNPINITDSIKHLADRETGEGRLAMIKFPVHTCQTPQAIDQIRKLQPHLFFLSFVLLLFCLF